MLGTKLVALALAGGVGAVGLGAWEAHGRGHREMFHKFVGFVIDEKLDEVGASAAQKEKIHAIRDRVVRKAEAMHGERREFHRELLALMEQDDPDPAQLKALVHQRLDKLSQFADEAADALVEAHNVLTPEQRQKLLAGVREHMRERGLEN